MEDNAFAGALQQTAVFDQMTSMQNQNTFSDDYFDDILNFDFKDFDFDILDSLPSPPPPDAFENVDSISSKESNAPASGTASLEQTAGFDGGKTVGSGDLGGGGMADGGKEKKEKRRLRKSITVAACGPPVSLGKRTLNSEELAELSRVDPKRVKRILCNRKSAAKSKAKKALYEKELHQTVLQLKIQVTDLVNYVIMIKKHTAENDFYIQELRITKEAAEQERQYKYALSAAIKNVVGSYRSETKQVDPMSSYVTAEELLASKFSSQLRLVPQETYLSMPNPLIPSSSQSFNGQLYGLSFSNFNQQN